MKRRADLTVDRSHKGAKAACGFMALAAILRLWHYLPAHPTGQTLWLHLLLPLLAAVCFLGGMLLGGKALKPGLLLSVALGVVFFILKARTFAPLHQALCTLLYCTVFLLFFGTVLGYIPTKKLLYPLFGLPLLYHIFVEDTQLYFFADPPVPVWDWMTELSVLSIMAGLFCLTFSMKCK